ncbi:MAG: hypothetical protein HYU64_12260 [Armatimonadetes bacterium]|nr:hypothetical protein [Armatimonadota bacterium]
MKPDETSPADDLESPPGLPAAVDFVLEWEESSEDREEDRLLERALVTPGEEGTESVGATPPPDTSVSLKKQEAAEGAVIIAFFPEEAKDEAAPDIKEAVCVREGELEEFFEWTAERYRAIEEALRETPGGTLPRVHIQLDEIRKALQEKRISRERAFSLLDEVDRYLMIRIEGENGKAPVSHEALVSSRAEMVKALYSYQEASRAIREYASTGDPMQLDLGVYSAEQGTSFIAKSRTVLFQAEPPPPEDSSS